MFNVRYYRSYDQQCSEEFSSDDRGTNALRGQVVMTAMGATVTIFLALSGYSLSSLLKFMGGDE